MQFSVVSRRKSLPSLGSTPLEHQPPVLARHAGAKTMRLRTAPVVGLKSALGHSDESPSKKKTVRLIAIRTYVKKTAAFLAPRALICTGTLREAVENGVL